jgi:hypothetical protein
VKAKKTQGETAAIKCNLEDTVDEFTHRIQEQLGVRAV